MVSDFRTTLAFLCFFVGLLKSHSWRCDYYFKYNEELGLSVYSGHIFESFDVFDVGVGVPVPLGLVYSGNELVNYVEAYNSTHALLTLGLGMLLNHNENPSKINIRKYLSEDLPLITFPSNHEPSIDIRFEYSASISRGDQLFVHYGEEWFEERGMAMTTTTQYLVDHDQEGVSTSKIAGCAKEYVGLQGGKLVAKRDVSAGVTIETVRAIFLPATSALLAYRGPLSDVLWWVKSFPASGEVAADGQVALSSTATDISHGLLLSGYGAFYGVHDSNSTSQQQGNVEARWEYDVPGKTSKGVFPLLLKFVANKAISKGEELVVANVEQQALPSNPSRRVLVK